MTSSVNIRIPGIRQTFDGAVERGIVGLSENEFDSLGQSEIVENPRGEIAFQASAGSVCAVDVDGEMRESEGSVENTSSSCAT